MGLLHPHMAVCLLSKHRLWDQELFHLSVLHCPWSDYQKIKLRWNTVMLCMEWSAVLVVNNDGNNKPVQSCAHCSAQPFVIMSLSDDDISYLFDIFCNKTPTCICAYKNLVNDAPGLIKPSNHGVSLIYSDSSVTPFSDARFSNGSFQWIFWTGS